MSQAVLSVRPPPLDTAAAEATRERILQAAEDLLRKYGPDKTRVVDVARALGMSHGNVYRHFESKDAIQQLVAKRWLRSISAPLAEIAHRPGPASYRLIAWLNRLVALKQEKVRTDPELFATYHALAETSGGVIEEHVDELRAQIAHIIADGVEQGEFKVSSPYVAATAVHDATARFQHPYFVLNHQHREERVMPVLNMILAALKAGAI